MKLTVNQAKRLREIVRARSCHAGKMKATTSQLEHLNLVEVTGREVAKTGRLMAAGIARATQAGLDWVKANPA